ncbi:hypothetical protein K435DRAFT_809477 [Dendrothele bispora CBS 962.96]|uniref:Uncharacterized protein n=1 Tax=Dendrothele bispora (strain CBS 962.96) TaxID=1314807 RepID=A0A4S8KZ89_DENBC|nr:hypothetical protein K435DRAFT_809477 [Dendrothele bispora CBS 962.96]
MFFILFLDSKLGYHELNPTNISHFWDELKTVAADHRDNVDDVCDKSSPIPIVMPLTQTQTSWPLSDHDLLVVKKWVSEMALGFLLLGVQYVIGDIVVVWRAWVLFPGRLAVKVTLLICLLGSFVGTFLDIGVLVKRVIKDFDDTGNKIMIVILTVPLIFTNFTATTLIGFKAWHHFHSIERNLGSTNRSSSKALKILLLLIESGLLYLAFWVISTIGFLVLGLTQDSGNIANFNYHVIMPGLVAIYPILINRKWAIASRGKYEAIICSDLVPNSPGNAGSNIRLRFSKWGCTRNASQLEFSKDESLKGLVIILVVAHENNKPDIRASKSEDHYSESGGESQLAFLAANINNSAEVEGNEIEVVPRLS